MPTYKLNLYSEWDGDGQTETYYTPVIADNNTLSTLLQTFFTKRTAFAYQNQVFQGLRLSIYGQRRQSNLYAGGEYINLPGVSLPIQVPISGTFKPTNLPEQVPTEWRVTANAAFNWGTFTRSTKYYSGVPSVLVGAEPDTFTLLAPQWLAAAQAFLQHLVARDYQVIAQPAPTPTTYFAIGQIVAAAAGGLIELVCKTPVGGATPTLTVGSQVKVAGIRPAANTKWPSLNGTWTVLSQDNSTYAPNFGVILQYSAGISAANYRVTANSTLSLPNKALQTLQSANFYYCGIHKRGKAPLAYRGRRSTKTSLAR